MEKVYSKYRIGPRTDPWGTQYKTSFTIDLIVNFTENVILHLYKSSLCPEKVSIRSLKRFLQTIIT